MDDRGIIELYWKRDEQAIQETADRYGAYCMRISMNILNNRADSDENVNDTYLRAWKSIPPARPASLMAYLAATARNLAINRYKASRAKKRAADTFALSLEELSDCTPAAFRVESRAEEAELGRCISRFLRTQPKERRVVFVRRYFYCEGIHELSESLGFSESKVKTMLMRTRRLLRQWLEREGYQI